MNRALLSLTLLMSSMLTLSAQTTDASAYFDGKPMGFATVSDEAGTAYTLDGGYHTSRPREITLTAVEGDNATAIQNAIANNDVIILDGSNGQFTISAQMVIRGGKHKTIVGCNNAILATEFYLTSEDIAYLNSQNLSGLSSTDQYTGTLPDGTTLTCDKRAFFTKKAIMELQHQKTGEYSLPNKAGIFQFDKDCENIIVRNLTLQGPGSVDIDGADLLYNAYAKHLWIDHCTFIDAQDGALDTRGDYSTYSWNKFYYTNRSFSHSYTCGLGWVSEHSTTLHVTWACNEWGQKCERRLPQADDAYLHLVNNYHNCAGNSAGMTLNTYVKALVEGNYAASGVKEPLTGSGANRQIYARDNSFNYTSTSTSVTVPYEYTKFDCQLVPSVLEGTNGAGATLTDNYMPAIEKKTPEVEGDAVLYFHPGEKNNKITFPDGATLQTTGNASKTIDPAPKITYQDNTYSSMKLSNGAQQTFTCPEGKKAVNVTFVSYINVDAPNRTPYWREINGTAIAEADATIMQSYKDAEHPDIISFSLPAVSSFTFTNAGEQVCVLMDVIYGDAAGITTHTVPTSTAIYNLAGQRVTTPSKGIVIINGKKVIM